jgi:hypothetical protein
MRGCDSHTEEGHTGSCFAGIVTTTLRRRAQRQVACVVVTATLRRVPRLISHWDWMQRFAPCPSLEGLMVQQTQTLSLVQHPVQKRHSGKA